VALLAAVAALAAAPAGRAAEINGSITIDGPSVPVTIAKPGDNETLSFNVSQENQKIFLQISNGSVGSTFSIREPGGHTLTSQFINHSGIFDTMKLGAPGTYSIYIDPSGTNTGSVTLTLLSVPDDVTGTIFANAQAVPVTIPHVGQGARIDFWGTDTTRIFLNISNGSVGSTFTIRDLNGNPLTNPLASQFINRSGYFDTRRLTYTGQYSITIDPAGTNTGSVTLTLYSVPEDINDTISANGQPKPVTIPNIGQNARYSFPASKDERVFLKVTNGSVGSTFAIKQGDTTLGSNFINTSNNIGPVNFNDAATGSVTIDPAGLNTGSVTLTLYEVPPDFRGTITPGGPPVPVPITTPGQNAYLSFPAAAGQSVRVVANDSTISLWDVSLTNPNSSVRTSSTGRGLGTFVALNWVSLAGEMPPYGNVYTIKIDPRDDKIGSVTIALDGSPGTSSTPSIAGFANADEMLVATPGPWTGNPPDFAYQWMRCDPTGASCVDLYGSGGPLFQLGISDINSTFRVRVTATNSYGSATAQSAATPVVLKRIDALALDYRPALLFDSSEHYRPITVGSLLAEKNSDDEFVHRRCDSVVSIYGPPVSICDVAGTISDLLAPPRPNSIGMFLSIWPYHASEDAYRSPSCPDGAFLRDCGDSAGIYYDYGQNSHGYRFVDYWFFYRYNPVSWDEHEGDWEGVTVELNPDPNMSNASVTGSSSSVTGAVYWAHGTPTFRLANALQWCSDGALDSTSCTTAVVSNHAADYVASGSHASYEYLCSDSCYNPRLNNNSENSHDGRAGWDDNRDSSCHSDSCVNAMTPVAGADAPMWPTWPGIWGGSTGNDATLDKSGKSPESPGNQTGFLCTQAGWNCSATPEGSPMPLALRHLQRAAPIQPSKRSRPFAFGKCASWYDGGLAAFACSPSQLRKTVAKNRLRSRGRFSLHVRGRHTGTAPGLVQVVGGPLAPHTSVRFVGRPFADEIVVINCMVQRKEYAIALTRLSLHGHAPTALLTIRGGRPAAALRGITARQRVRLLKPRTTSR
jgi:hypothetical protein